MALAVDKAAFTLPHNIQEFRMNLGFLPALWAEDGDCVLVDDMAFAVKALIGTGLRHADVLFLTDKEVGRLTFDGVDAWGWDKAVRRRLSEAGVGKHLLPSDEKLAFVRDMANRNLTTDVLMAVCEGLGTSVCGKSFYVNNLDSLTRLLASYGKVVLKAPWSSSGRGIRYVNGCMTGNVKAWVENTIRLQGGLMVEPCYQRVADFAMEFESRGNAGIDYCGLSVFHTEHGNYAGNIIADENEKKSMLMKYVEPELLDIVRQRIMAFFDKQFRRCYYKGCFGVDMMIVASADGGRCKLHPCVEVNFRRTMGHVANSLRKRDANAPLRFMRISHGVNYTFRIVTPDPGFVKVL